ncbi:hypothetical protein BDV97DRAFT_368245 [Delphinella strobiligena]|nr:hypothetical protein BDV97DRAFT_368245 [Delphinella strobiligena]
MADNELIVAVIALIVAMVALIIAVLQMLQQYSATADGYRPSKTSLMAGWAQYTHRKIVWPEFRLETTYVVPHLTFIEKTRHPCNSQRQDERTEIDMADEKIDCQSPDDNWRREDRNHVFEFDPEDWDLPNEYSYFLDACHERPRFGSIIGKLASIYSSFMPCGKIHETSSLPQARAVSSTNQSIDESSVPDKSKLWGGKMDMGGEGTEISGWVQLMRSLREMQESLRQDQSRLYNKLPDTQTVPAFRVIKRSWANMSSSVMRPYASICVRDLVIMVRILGMEWTNKFKPLEGKFHADGRSCLLRSDFVQVLGPVAEFRRARKRGPYQTLASFIPMAEAYRLLFGIITCDRKIMSPEKELHMANQGAWNMLVSDMRLPFKVAYLPADLMPLVAPMYRTLDSCVLVVAKPYKGRILGWLSRHAVFATFLDQLKEYRKQRASVHGGEVVDSIIERLQQIESNGRGPIWSEILPKPRTMTDKQRENMVKACNAFQENFIWTQDQIVKLQETVGIKDVYLQVVFKHLHLLGSSKAHANRHRRHMEIGHYRGRGGRNGPILTETSRDTDSPDSSDRDERTSEADFLMSTPAASRLQFLFANLAEVVNFVDTYTGDEGALQMGDQDRDRVEVLYIAMLFRGMCWLRCHIIDKEDPVPSKYWTSRQRIYLL